MIIQRILFNNDRNIVKRTYIWNLIANLLYSLQSAVLLLIVTRYGGTLEGGIFSIIYTTTHMFASIGNYNMRNFQVSDATNEYDFRDYWTSRVVSCIVMCVAGLAYGIIRFDEPKTVIVVLFFVGYRLTEAIEDVIHGCVQKDGRLDAVSLARSSRILIASVVFSIVYVVSSDLFLASGLLFGISLGLLVIFTIALNKRYRQLSYGLYFKRIIKLLWSCLPLCISAFLQSYIVNSPKYAIDAVLSSEMQTVFNILFMPLFAINVLSIFLFNPLVADMGLWWTEGNYGKLVKCIIKQILIVLGLTIVLAVCGYLIGCEVLGWVYGVELIEYKKLFMTLMLFGGISAIVTFMSVIVTIVRKQGFIIVAYGIASIVSLVVSNKIVSSYGLKGAGILYGMLMGIVMVVLTIVIVSVFLKKRR